MASWEVWKRKIALIMVIVLLLAPAVQASAEEFAEETEQLLASEGVEVTESTGQTEYPQAPETSEEPEPTEETEETEADRETEAQETPSRPEQTVLPIAQVLKMASGTDTILIEGTVVFAMGPQAVLQDDTGGIRLSFASAPDIGPGDTLLVTGHRSGGFAVEDFEKTGTGELPAREATLAEDQQALRIVVRGVTLERKGLSQNGYTCRLVGTIPEGLAVGHQADVWGVVLDGVFYADTMAAPSEPEPDPTEPDTTEPETSEPDNPRPVSNAGGSWNLYFGQLHAHTDISDGLGTVEEAFAHAREAENLDFFAVTDHSNSFDNADECSVGTDGSAISQEWAAGKAAAKNVTDETFVGIFGYEMTWPEDLAIGHINTFATPGWQTRDQAGMNTLKGYLDALAAVPGSVSQFNHPGPVYGDFRSFSEYDPRQDARVHLLEVGGEGSFTAYDAYTAALDAGWHLAPSNNQNNHNGHWGSADTSRTVVLARELTEDAIYDALRNYRVYATEDWDLKIRYRLNGSTMGSVIVSDGAALMANISLEDGSGDPIGLVEVVTEGGEAAASLQVPEAGSVCSLEIPGGGSYYYLRISREGKIVAVTAPIWVDTYDDLGISSFTADREKPDQGETAALSLTLYNHEDAPFVVESVEFIAGEDVIGTLTAPGSVAPAGELKIPLSYSRSQAGTVTLQARVTGTIAGLSRSFRQEVTLHYQAVGAQQLPIADVRDGIPGESYRIRGYVTAGTAKPCNSFPGSIYLQDDSGGIPVTDFTREDIQVGTPMEIEGVLRSQEGNLVLAMTDFAIAEESYYRYVPRTMTHSVAMDYEAHGGQLLQIEGTVVSVTLTPDEKGVCRFTLQDIVGDLATVLVEEGIGSGAYGTNELSSEVKTTRTVRAMGLLHRDEYGQSVLRVRNCDEVVYVPPVRDSTNPKTGDLFASRLFPKK